MENMTPEALDIASKNLADEIDRELLKVGDKFTVQGVKIKKDGTITTRCKKGNESIYTVIKKEDK